MEKISPLDNTVLGEPNSSIDVKESFSLVTGLLTP